LQFGYIIPQPRCFSSSSLLLSIQHQYLFAKKGKFAVFSPVQLFTITIVVVIFMRHVDGLPEKQLCGIQIHKNNTHELNRRKKNRYFAIIKTEVSALTSSVTFQRRDVVRCELVLDVVGCELVYLFTVIYI